MKIIHSHSVPKTIQNIRLQEYAPKIFKDYIPSNSGIKKAIKRGQFLINGTIAKTGSWVNADLVIDLIENPFKKPTIYMLDMEVVFEDEHMAIINKPAGITVSGNSFKTVVNALPHNLKISSELDSLATPTPVHRLDNQTSGLLLIAKTKTAQIELGQQFETKTIQKKYITIVEGEIQKNNTITTPIENKPSKTSFEIINVVKSLKYKELSFLHVYPKTGRTHQIRIHLSSIGHPIFGDKLYGNIKTLHKGKGLFLCASEIVFAHPKTGLPTTVKIETPPKFESLLNREQRRWNTYSSPN